METQQNSEVLLTNNKKSIWSTVTPFSKYLSMALFIILPFIGGYVGYSFSPVKVIEMPATTSPSETKTQVEQLNPDTPTKPPLNNPDAISEPTSNDLFEITAIRWGSSFGECGGYCFRESVFSPSGGRLISQSWQEKDDFPDAVATFQISASDWNAYVDSVDLEEMLALPDVIGCPDCADGGAEWVEIEYNRMRKKVEYEFSQTPDALQKLTELLDAGDLNKLNIDNTNAPIQNITWGTSFGHCVGYCVREISINQYDLYSRAIGWRDEFPEKEQVTPTIAGQWSNLTNSFDSAKFLELPERIGCPDCADGGAEFIEVQFLDGVSKRVTFEYGNPLEGLEYFLEQLRAIGIENQVEGL